jgi:uncharacterized membrane protein
MALNLLFLFAALFVLSHLGLSSDRIKKPLVKAIGDKPFMGLYSLVALATLGCAIWMYAGLGARGPALWVPLGWDNPVPYVLMLLSILFIVLGSVTPSPVGADMGMGAKPVARGILRVTAHPQNWGMVCFGLAHVLVTGTAGALALYGMFVLTGMIGMYHETAKKRKDGDAEVQAFLKETGLIPFSAIVRGKNKFVVGEFGIMPIFAALIVFGLSIVAHFVL